MLKFDIDLKGMFQLEPIGNRAFEVVSRFLAQIR